ncbi:hypothetical protein BO83DRAFT_376635 [Aspergillus eucalypticola CBS 122712]|uniref:LITAF domain-containing protein n=1 Tax=Aspergillus eucalypticola (strain CBS 122712 / IBT 29274) TaxID=1448314 RepID=A0A317W0E6_ASPEC|nr:uncharacterized protein BO83DRAFT_376635 [Aspergillus eucalypticola CBS 122712]PWY77610.1 hypothetical protein BO83DRAFT_376635 [Aspergillus eucalypticola CBS 122712]
MAEKANPPAVPTTYEEQQQTETHELSSRDMPAYAQPPIEQTPEIQPHQPQQTFYAGSQHPSGYNTPTPLYALQKTPAPVDCPACGERKMTRVEAETGSSTHAWAAVLCCCLCLGCIPYMMSSLKNQCHYCGNCGVLLATWHNSGRTDVHRPGSKE